MKEHPRTMTEVYENREELARTANDAWLAASVKNTRKIVAHPLFPQLVREVAVAEQNPPGHYGWLRRNSLTYGTWMTRGTENPRTGPLTRRARVFSERIARDLDWSSRDDFAKVYVTARDWVQSRQFPHTERNDGTDHN